MKAVLIASSISIGFALATGSASAADLLPLKAPPPVYSWTGCYIDAGVGYGMWNQSHTDEELTPSIIAVGPSTTTGGEGWLGRVGVGCDYQIAPRWVIGAFADYDFMNLSGTFSEPFFGDFGNETEKWSWAAGARIGYLVTPKLLAFFDGGFTQAKFSQISLNTWTLPPPITIVSTGTDIPAHTYNGWFLGGGYEYALWDIVPIPGLFWRTEYRYDRYNSADLPVVNSTTGAPSTFGSVACDVDGVCGNAGQHMQKDVQTVTTGVVWKFNFGGPAHP